MKSRGFLIAAAAAVLALPALASGASTRDAITGGGPVSYTHLTLPTIYSV